MAYTTINKSGDYFNTKLYTGNGSTQSITGVGFQPDFVWLKQRSSGVYYHRLQDSVRGAGKPIYSNRTDAEGDFGTGTTGSIRTFDTDGFSIGSDAGSNDNNVTMASWNWLANGAGSANTDGSINSTVSANTTSGFSIVSYTGNANSTATVGHGLGVAPSMIIFKRRSTSANWFVYHKSTGAGKSLKLNTTDGESSNTISFGNTTPTSTVFTVGDDGGDYGTNYPNGGTFVAYCFAEKTGYSKFGSYAGNQNDDGTFVYTGFKPAFVMVKRYSAGNPSATNWVMLDNKRDPENTVDKWLYANKTDLEYTASSAQTDFVSNGFKIRGTGSFYNDSGHNYIYMAFAEAPLVGTNNVPCTAR